MPNIQRIHCHSAFKHYEMFHSGHDSGYGNSVFNTTYNFNCGYGGFGGGFWGGLWGGLGMGLGAGLMNLLGGNMFGGGFPMMNMFGGFPMMNMWGGGAVSDGIGGKDKAKNDKDDHECKKCEDHDREKLTNLRDKVYELKHKENITQDEIDNLKAEIEDAKSKSDDNHKLTDEKAYNQLLRDLKDLKATEPAQPTEPTKPVEPAEPTEPTEPTKPVNDTTKKDINGITEDEISKLSAEQAKDILKNSKRLNDDDTVKVPRNYKELLLAQKSGLIINFCKNIDSIDDRKKSATIKGKINSLTEKTDENGKKSYVVEVKDKYGKYTLKIDFNTNEIEVTDAKGAKIKYRDNKGNTVTRDLTKLSKGKAEDKYTIGDDWATRKGDPLVR